MTAFYLRISVTQAVKKKEVQKCFLEKQIVVTLRAKGEGCDWEGVWGVRLLGKQGSISSPGRYLKGVAL